LINAKKNADFKNRFPKITDQGLRSLFQAMKETVSLTTIELDFYGFLSHFSISHKK